jgi:Rrf2 family transcriptional regulator, iron-sulfur cluster assembly transcription factor
MIYSRSAEYAIRAFVYLASTPPDQYVMAKKIAADTSIPSHFLAKILQQLARKGFLRSSKGPTGGFCLRQAAGKVSMLDIVDSVDGLQEYKRCISGFPECNDEAPCGLHDSWKPIRSRIIEYLEGTSIAEVADSQQQKVRAMKKEKKGGRRALKRG